MIKSPLEINHVWPENYSVNSAMKVWAAAFAAHHPNDRGARSIELQVRPRCATAKRARRPTSFKPSKTPSAALHDIDANKPGGSIKIRVKTYAHSLRLAQERLEDLAGKKRETLALSIDKKRLELLGLEARRQLAGAEAARPWRFEKQIAETIGALARLRSADARPKSEAPKGVFRLGRKQADGSIVTIDLSQRVIEKRPRPRPE